MSKIRSDNNRDNYYAERERRAIEKQRESIQRQENNALRERISRRNKNIQRIRSNTIGAFASMSVGRITSRAIRGFLTGNFWQSILIFFCCFALVSQIFFNSNIDIITGRDLTSDGFIKEEVLEENFKPYDVFNRVWGILSETNFVSLDGVIWALNNYDTLIKDYYTTRFSSGSSGSSNGRVGFLGSFIFGGSATLFEIPQLIRAVGNAVANAVNTIRIIVNTFYLLLCFAGVGIETLLLILRLVGITGRYGIL